MALWLFTGFCLIAFCGEALSIANGTGDIKQLFSDLMDGYDTRIRPRSNQSDNVAIQVLFVPNFISEFETANQKLTIQGYFFCIWTDEYLTWTPTNYQSISRIKIPIDQIWSPILTVTMPYSNSIKVGSDTTQVVVLEYGAVMWSSFNILSILCTVNTQYYPFDNQTCRFNVQAVDELSNEVSFILFQGGIDTTNFYENSEWHVTDIIPLKTNTYYNDMVIYEFQLKRRLTFIVYTMIIPLLILSFMNVGVFLIPSSSGEKGSLAATLFLSYGVFVSTITNSLPNNSTNMSYFVIYICLLLIFSMLTVVYAIVESRICIFKGNDVVQWPELFKKMFQKSNRIEDNAVITFDQNQADTDEKVGKVDQQHDDTEVKKRKESAFLKMTWEQLLSTCDIILFIVFLLFDIILTTTFFTLMSKS